MHSSTTEKAYTLAIVGGGAACISFLHHLVHFGSHRRGLRIKVLVFEKRPVVGPGYAYQHDTDDLLLNRVAGAMSINHLDPAMFARWLEQKAASSPEAAAAVRGSFPDIYLPRRLFGRFLNDSFREIQRISTGRGIEIDVIHEDVCRIEYAPSLTVFTPSKSCAVDDVLLAVGHREPYDHYGLGGSTNYINCIFPFSAHVERLLCAKSICILGSSLTAVDAVVALRSHGYTGSVDLLSLRGLLPPVKGPSYPPHELKHLTTVALGRLLRANPQGVTLREALRLLRRELNEVDVAWKDLFGSVDQDAQSLLGRDIATAQSVRPWAPIFRSVNDIVHELWNALDDSAQHTFRTNFARQWMSIRTPIPLQNAVTLQSMMKSGQLHVYKGPASLREIECGGVELVLPNSTSRRYELAVNATGDIDSFEPSKSELVSSLLLSGIASPDKRGGIRVDFRSGALVSRSGTVDQNIRALGRVTSGTYFYVDSLEMISRQAHRICDDLFRNDR